MKNTTELQLQKLALVLTGAVVLQVLWSGTSLLLLSAPDPIFPAEASLRVEDIRYSLEPDGELFSALDSRPVFWRGREAYVPPDDTGKNSGPVKKQSSKAIDEVTLKGVYTGAKPGIIVLYKGQRRRLLLNESIADWTFTMLSADSAVFESKEDSRALRLEHASPVAKAKAKTKARGGMSRRKDSTDNLTDNDEKAGE